MSHLQFSLNRSPILYSFKTLEDLVFHAGALFMAFIVAEKDANGDNEELH